MVSDISWNLSGVFVAAGAVNDFVIEADIRFSWQDELDFCLIVGLRIRLHDLRHSHVALLVELGYRVEEIAERIGDSVQVVTETYLHLYPGKQKKIAAELSKHRDGFNTRVLNIKKDATANQQ